MATAATLDFSNVDRDDLPRSAKFADGRPKKLTPKQIRARARRAQKKGGMAYADELSLLHKPIEEWDNEELARGRPRASDGTFKGKAPEWIHRAIHEQAVDKFKELVKQDLSVHTLTAITTVKWILECDDLDEKDKPVVPASTKLDAAKFLIEQLLGKPKQEVKADISVKLQGILAAATVTGDAPLGIGMGYTDAPSWEDDEEEEGGE